MVSMRVAAVTGWAAAEAVPIPSVSMVGGCGVVFVTRFTVYERLKHPNLDLLSLRFTTAFMTLLGEEIPLLGKGILVVIL